MQSLRFNYRYVSPTDLSGLTAQIFHKKKPVFRVDSAPRNPVSYIDFGKLKAWRLTRKEISRRGGRRWLLPPKPGNRIPVPFFSLGLQGGTRD